MNGHIGLIVSSSSKQKMLNIKTIREITLSNQLKDIISSFLTLNIEQMTDKIIELYPLFDEKPKSTITISKEYLVDHEFLTKLLNLSKIKVPKLTFKSMIFLIVEWHFQK